MPWSTTSTRLGSSTMRSPPRARGATPRMAVGGHHDGMCPLQPGHRQVWHQPRHDRGALAQGQGHAHRRAQRRCSRRGNKIVTSSSPRSTNAIDKLDETVTKGIDFHLVTSIERCSPSPSPTTPNEASRQGGGSLSTDEEIAVIIRAVTQAVRRSSVSVEAQSGRKHRRSVSPSPMGRTRPTSASLTSRRAPMQRTSPLLTSRP